MAKKQLETSVRRLNTTHFHLLKIEDFWKMWPSKFLLSVSCFLIFLQGTFASVNGSVSRPRKDSRINACLNVTIKLYNLTIHFEEKMLMSVKHEYFENILGEDGQEIVEHFELFESDVKEYTAKVESWNGIRPDDETAEDVDYFSMTLQEEYEELRQLTLDFAAKLQAAHESVLNSKKALIKHLRRFSKLRENFAKCKPLLAKVGIVLKNPSPEFTAVTETSLFDISLLLSLQKILKEITTIEDQIRQTVGKYKHVEDIPEDSEDAGTVRSGLERLAVLEDVQLKNFLTQNDQMLRQYEPILNLAIEKALQRVSEVEAEFEDLQQVVIRTADEHIGYDRKLRAAIENYVDLIQNSNVAIVNAAIKNKLASKMNKVDQKDEL